METITEAELVTVNPRRERRRGRGGNLFRRSVHNNPCISLLPSRSRERKKRLLSLAHSEQKDELKPWRRDKADNGHYNKVGNLYN